jgi:NADH-quinone oxidoreductase subunit E
MLRRLHHDQPASFAFTPANEAWADGQISKYPEGRQASAIIPLLWRAQEQEGWLTRPAIEHIANKLGLANIRALEVATFYFMFQLQPVGSVAHIQVCGTTSCMICGAEDLVGVCEELIASKPHVLSADGKFSWEEVECLGACANAPMAQIGKDYYEDLTAVKLRALLADLAAGKVPQPGSQIGRFAAEPASGLTSLTEFTGESHNGSVALALSLGDTLKRIDGTEVPLLTPWRDGPSATHSAADAKAAANAEAKAEKLQSVQRYKGIAPLPKPILDKNPAVPVSNAPVPVTDAPAVASARPESLDAAREGGADDLKLIKGVGPKLEQLLHTLGFFHFDQIAAWSPAELAWVDDNLAGFKGRASRDEWLAQAKVLAAGGTTEFSSRQ